MNKTTRDVERHGLGRAMVLAGSALAISLLSATAPALAHSTKTPKKPPLVLADEGSFFVNGKVVTTQYSSAPAAGLPAPGKTIVNQMYVRYMIPDKVREYSYKSGKKTVKAKVPAIIMFHGSGHTGATFETTPDGREGWANYFVRQGFPVYNVDHSGRARSGFNQDVINKAKIENNASILPSVVKTTLEAAWTGFRVGPEYGVQNPGQQFPIAAFEHYAAQLVPNAEVTLDGGASNSSDAITALLDKVGPAIIIAHSQGSSYGLAGTVRRPNLVKGLVLLEGSCAATASEITSAFVKSPFTAIIGDYRPADRNVQCQDTVSAINAKGGNARFWLLPATGIKGNTHMMMMDKNSDKVAAKLQDWLLANIK